MARGSWPNCKCMRRLLLILVSIILPALVCGSENVNACDAESNDDGGSRKALLQAARIHPHAPRLIEVSSSSKEWQASPVTEQKPDEDRKVARTQELGLTGSDATKESDTKKLDAASVEAVSNHVMDDAPGVGFWGGSCTCPDGNVYQVGDNGDWCNSLACFGGTSGSCNFNPGPWSGRRVVCAQVPMSTKPAASASEKANVFFEVHVKEAKPVDESLPKDDFNPAEPPASEETPDSITSAADVQAIEEARPALKETNQEHKLATEAAALGEANAAMEPPAANASKKQKQASDAQANEELPKVAAIKEVPSSAKGVVTSDVLSAENPQGEKAAQPTGDVKLTNMTMSEGAPEKKDIAARALSELPSEEKTVSDAQVKERAKHATMIAGRQAQNGEKSPANASAPDQNEGVIEATSPAAAAPKEEKPGDDRQPKEKHHPMETLAPGKLRVKDGVPAEPAAIDEIIAAAETSTLETPEEEPYKHLTKDAKPANALMEHTLAAEATSLEEANGAIEPPAAKASKEKKQASDAQPNEELPKEAAIKELEAVVANIDAAVVANMDAAKALAEKKPAANEKAAPEGALAESATTSKNTAGNAKVEAVVANMDAAKTLAEETPAAKEKATPEGTTALKIATEKPAANANAEKLEAVVANMDAAVVANMDAAKALAEKKPAAPEKAVPEGTLAETVTTEKNTAGNAKVEAVVANMDAAKALAEETPGVPVAKEKATPEGTTALKIATEKAAANANAEKAAAGKATTGNVNAGVAVVPTDAAKVAAEEKPAAAQNATLEGTPAEKVAAGKNVAEVAKAEKAMAGYTTVDIMAGFQARRTPVSTKEGAFGICSSDDLCLGVVEHTNGAYFLWEAGISTAAVLKSGWIKQMWKKETAMAATEIAKPKGRTAETVAPENSLFDKLVAAEEAKSQKTTSEKATAGKATTGNANAEKAVPPTDAAKAAAEEKPAAAQKATLERTPAQKVAAEKNAAEGATAEKGHAPEKDTAKPAVAAIAKSKGRTAETVAPEGGVFGKLLAAEEAKSQKTESDKATAGKAKTGTANAEKAVALTDTAKAAAEDKPAAAQKATLKGTPADKVASKKSAAEGATAEKAKSEGSAAQKVAAETDTAKTEKAVAEKDAAKDKGTTKGNTSAKAAAKIAKGDTTPEEAAPKKNAGDTATAKKKDPQEVTLQDLQDQMELTERADSLPRYLYEIGLSLFRKEEVLNEFLARTKEVSVDFPWAKQKPNKSMRLRLVDGDLEPYFDDEEDLYELNTFAEKDVLFSNNSMINMMDIGGNIGVVTIASFLKNPEKMRIIAVEPLPQSYFLFRWNLWLNNIAELTERELESDVKKPGVLVINKGIWDSDRQMHGMCYTSPFSVTANVCDCNVWRDDDPFNPAKGAEQCHAMTTIKIESLWAMINQEPLAMLKLDCEGCEAHVVPALAQSPMKRQIGRLAGELHKASNELEDIVCSFDEGRRFNHFCNMNSENQTLTLSVYDRCKMGSARRSCAGGDAMHVPMLK